jgi:hypothetical protein
MAGDRMMDPKITIEKWRRGDCDDEEDCTSTVLYLVGVGEGGKYVVVVWGTKGCASKALSDRFKGGPAIPSTSPT